MIHLFSPVVGIIIGFLAIWEIYWKGRGLWAAARNDEMGWFIAMLIINSVGILPILYLYVFHPEPTIRR